MWGCLGKFMVLMTVLVMLGATATIALATAAAVAVPNLMNSRVSATVPGFDTVLEARVTSDPQLAALAYPGPFSAFGMSPGEWIVTIALAMCLMLTVALGAGMVGMLRHHRRHEPDDARESETMQELHHLALRMDERIETLETLLLGQGPARD